MDRRGPFHNFAGVRLPSSPAPPGRPDDIGDPANGEAVARCLTCGTPNEPVTGRFIPDKGGRYAGRVFRYRLCATCIAHANGPQPADPLDVSDVA